MTTVSRLYSCLHEIGTFSRIYGAWTAYVRSGSAKHARAQSMALVWRSLAYELRTFCVCWALVVCPRWIYHAPSSCARRSHGDSFEHVQNLTAHVAHVAYAWRSSAIPLRMFGECKRVSHNQGYHLVCIWGQKWSFLYCPKKQLHMKEYNTINSVWNPNFAKLSLIFIEIQQLGKPQSDETFLCWGCYTMLIWYTFYWVLLMMFFNWTY